MDSTPSLTRNPLPSWLVTGMRWLLALTWPAFLILTGVQLVATEAFLYLEYNRPGFPEDHYGFTLTDRLTYAPYAVRYLCNEAEIDYLGTLIFDNGTPLFNAEELQHMEDVKAVTQTAFTVHILLSLILSLMIIVLAWHQETRWALRRGLSAGGSLTIFLIITLVVVIIASWDFFFDGFHALLFEGDSWQFYTSDTLIRLFPEQFWFDAVLSIGALTLLGAVSAIIGVWYWERRLHRRAQQRLWKQNEAANSPVINSTTLEER